MTSPSLKIHRRDAVLFISGLLIGGLLVALGFTLWINRAAIRRMTYPLFPQKYAARSCLEAAPRLANGAQVWMRNPRPAPTGTAIICARLVIDGKVVNGAAMRGTIRIITNRDTVFETGMGTMLGGQDGILQTGIGGGDFKLDEPVQVDVQMGVDENGPFIYKAHTSFTPSNNFLPYPPPDTGAPVSDSPTYPPPGE